MNVLGILHAALFISVTAALPARSQVAGPKQTDHYVPVEKHLDPARTKTLHAKGERSWYGGGNLETIGMPCGGIGAGQVYLCGDGRLGHWGISSDQPQTYWYRREKMGPITPLGQGFVIRVHANQQTVARSLDRKGFPNVRFCGEYPVGTIEYQDAAFPVAVDLEAFSPFIPLEELDSTLPATLMRFTITNRSASNLDVELLGWLENALGRKGVEGVTGRSNRLLKHEGLAVMRCDLQEQAPLPQRQTLAVPAPILYADFEGDNYGHWAVSGQAMGTKPVPGTLTNQQPVTGYQGKGLVNSYLGGDGPQGDLRSPLFTIKTPFISFLIGGGNHPGQACINLRVAGEVVRTATGKNNELLAWLDWNVADLAGKEAQIEILDHTSAYWGHINIDHIQFRHDPVPRPATIPFDWGTLALSVLGPPDTIVADASLSGPLPGTLLNERSWEGQSEAEGPLDQPLPGAVGRRIALPAGAGAQVTFIISWHLPHLRYRPGYGGETKDMGRYYTKRFADASEVAQYIAQNVERLAGQTQLWHDTYYDSTLPHWLLDRLHAPVSSLASKTCDWWRNGLFFGWEGGIQGGDVTTHVWNYAHALARLFPRLEKSIREMRDLNTAFNAETGAVGTWGIQGQNAAADGQVGTVLKAYRDHLLSTDSTYLEFNWPRIRLALEYSIAQDGNQDGLIENDQFNTYDCSFYGRNTFVGSLYLAALRAGEEMAREMGDEAFAKKCRAIYESGRKLTMETFFDGEYFVQEVDLQKHPKFQYRRGCLSDQLFGQNWAHQVNLGYLYPQPAVTTAMQSVWKYNWAPDVGPQNKIHPPYPHGNALGRFFALPGEAGLFNCTWPHDQHPGGNEESVYYRDEVWTGVEYQVAAGMAWEGMVTEALAICRGIYERYHPAKRNPWNEVEWGDHYTRGLASWGVLIALSGFEYHGPAGHIGFTPNITPEAFKSVFTAAEGWGSISQNRTGHTQTDTCEVKWGRLRVTQFGFELPERATLKDLGVTVAGKTVAAMAKQDGRRVTVALAAESVIEARQAAEVKLTF